MRLSISCADVRGNERFHRGELHSMDSGKALTSATLSFRSDASAHLHFDLKPASFDIPVAIIAATKKPALCPVTAHGRSPILKFVFE